MDIAMCRTRDSVYHGANQPSISASLIVVSLYLVWFIPVSYLIEKGFGIPQLHHSNHDLFISWGWPECRTQKKIRLQRDVKPAIPFHQCSGLLWPYFEWWFHRDWTKFNLLEKNPAHRSLWYRSRLSILPSCL